MCSEAARRCFSAVLGIGLVGIELWQAKACTVFSHGLDDTILAGRSFDVPDDCSLAMVFVPAAGKTHGRVRSGRSSGPCADGMNTQGLFVAVADVPTPWTSKSSKAPADLNTFVDGLLANCATVDEAFAWCKNQPTPRLGGWVRRWSVGNSQHPLFARYTFVTLQHVLVADRMGNSMVFEWVRGRFTAIRKKGRYQLMTNFLLSAPECGSYPCARFTTDTAILDASAKPSLATCVAVLKATAVGTTKYSLACDLVRGNIQVHLRRDFSHPKLVNLADELQKGFHQLELDKWFETERPQPPSLPEVTPNDRIAADEVLRRALEARGGLQAAQNIRSFHARGTINWSTGWPAVSPAEAIGTRSNQWRFIVDEKSGSGQILGRFDSGYDGQNGWEGRAGAAPQRLTRKRLEQQRENAEFFAWYDDPERFHSKKCVGEADFEGQRCYALKLGAKLGCEETHYYNVTNFLLAGAMKLVEADSGPTLLKKTFSDYREFGGFLFPTRQGYVTQSGAAEVQYYSVEVNTSSDSAFKLPTLPEIDIRRD